MQMSFILENETKLIPNLHKFKKQTKSQLYSSEDET